MISTGELKKGVCVEVDGDLLRIVNYEHIKMGRGSAQVKIKFQNIRTGAIYDRGYNAGTKFKRASLDHRNVQYQYEDGGLYHFMDTESYEQVTLDAEHLGEDVGYLKENVTLEVLTYKDAPVGVELPITVDLKVTETEPGFKGDTATGGNKPATLETGLKIMVPLFVGQGDTIKVDTRTGNYLERV
jgi:elongation factor P